MSKTRLRKTKFANIKVGKNVVATDRVEVRPDFRRIRVTKETQPQEVNLFLVASDQAELLRITREARKQIKGKNLPEEHKQKLLKAIIQLEQAKTKNKIINWAKKNSEALIVVGAVALVTAGLLKGEQTAGGGAITIAPKKLYGFGIPLLLISTATAIKDSRQIKQLEARLKTKLDRQYTKQGYTKDQAETLSKRDVQKIEGIIK